MSESDTTASFFTPLGCSSTVGGPVLSFREDDKQAQRLAAAVILQPGVKLASAKAVAEGLGLSRSMVFDYRRRYAEGGAAAPLTGRPGPKGPLEPEELRGLEPERLRCPELRRRAGQVAAGALGRQLSQISMETIRRNMDVRPTLEVKAGTPFYIFLARDLVLEDPYIDQRTIARQP